VISDVQHAAGIPDGKSFHGVPRFYAAALEGARRAGRAFARDCVPVVIHLGDTVDGQHALRGEGSSEEALKNVVEALVGGEGEEEDDDGNDDNNPRRPRRQRPTLLNLTSNHDLYNFGGRDRGRLNALLGITPPEGKEHAGASYYSASLAPGWRALGLDSYDVSLLGRAPGDERHERAAATLRARNPNGSDDKPQGWDSPEGLKGVARRFVRFGGGASAKQVEWLRAELRQARARGERVLVLNHLPLHPATAPPACLLWNYDEVVAALEEFPGTVAAVLTGHAHMNGYFFAPHGTGAAEWEGGGEEDGVAAGEAGAGAGAGGGIHHLVLPCVLETPPDRDCWAVLDIHEKGMVLRGVDTCMSLAMAVGQVAAAETTAARAAAAAAASEAEAADALARVALSS
jgi:manganese-dependent ADP-ribose/CDP-alcohol diphosphatase